jgi:hypothetical protein
VQRICQMRVDTTCIPCRTLRNATPVLQ